MIGVSVFFVLSEIILDHRSLDSWTENVFKITYPVDMTRNYCIIENDLTRKRYQYYIFENKLFLLEFFCWMTPSEVSSYRYQFFLRSNTFLLSLKWDGIDYLNPRCCNGEKFYGIIGNKPLSFFLLLIVRFLTTDNFQTGLLLKDRY